MVVVTQVGHKGTLLVGHMTQGDVISVSLIFRQNKVNISYVNRGRGYRQHRETQGYYFSRISLFCVVLNHNNYALGSLLMVLQKLHKLICNVEEIPVIIGQR